jgi:hypothetical protein
MFNKHNLVTAECMIITSIICHPRNQCTMEWSSPAHYGKLGDTPNIIGRVRSFQDIKVLGWQIEQFKKKMMFNRHILVPIMSI